MKILGLSIGQLFAALIFGVIVSVAITFAMAPHPVNIPVQTITPVPTPPPVVITERQTLVSTGNNWNTTYGSIVTQMEDTMSATFGLVTILPFFFTIIFALGFFNRE